MEAASRLRSWEAASDLLRDPSFFSNPFGVLTGIPLACSSVPRSLAAFEVLTRADDGSFQLRDFVRATAPHYPFRTEYNRGSRAVISEVTAMAIAPD